MRNWMLVPAVLALAACGGLKSAEAPPLNYRLTAPELAAGPALAADVVIPRPTAGPGLDNDRIATRLPGLRLDYYAGARWSAGVPAMVQSALIESLQGAGRLRSAQGDLGRFRATHVLDVEVRRFDADYTAGALPVARVTLAVTVGRQSDRRVVASFVTRGEAPAGDNRLGAVVQSLDAAWGQAATEAATRALEAIAADLARQP